MLTFSADLCVHGCFQCFSMFGSLIGILKDILGRVLCGEHLFKLLILFRKKKKKEQASSNLMKAWLMGKKRPSEETKSPAEKKPKLE